MDKDLEAKIIERKRSVAEKKIEYKAVAIADFLGKGRKWDDSRDTASRDFEFNDGKFLIKDYFYVIPEEGIRSKVDVVYLGQTVYQSRKQFQDPEIKITSYVPGEWEDEFNDLYIEALRAEQNVEAKETVSEEAELRAKWGL